MALEILHEKFAAVTSSDGDADMERLLNLGCGLRYRVDLGWSNIDFKGIPGDVVAHDLAKGIPFSDRTFDVVYHSHVLEHFSREGAARLMRECFRVLKPGGFCRVVVPDMEGICRNYLDALEAVLQRETQAHGRYRWMVIEMLDQLVRHSSGGEMAAYLQQTWIPERSFIVGRIGDIAKFQRGETHTAQTSRLALRSSWVRRGWGFGCRKLSALRRGALSLVLSRHEMRALGVGLFRLQGESHLWMYDRYSLSEVMRQAGFDKIEKCMATSSRFTGWEHHSLDTDKDGTTYKPDSLYMEGVRPE